VGFRGLDVQQDGCGDWEVDLRGLKTESQRRDFRSEAAGSVSRSASRPANSG
jgi:hypothetical protein